MEFSRSEARAMLLAVQGLISTPDRATKQDVRAVIQRMGVLQIDSISVVARSPYLVLWSRLGGYDPRWLDELLAEGALFEYWSHAACFLPIEDYGLYRSRMLQVGAKTAEWSRTKTVDWIKAHPEEVGRVMSHIRKHGPTRSAEFKRTDGKAGGWWEWKPEKRALEHLLSAGELMISHRENFHRVYDLRERVLERALPDWQDTQAPTPEEARRAFALKAVYSLGVAVARWVPDYYRTPKGGVAGLLEGLADEGALLRAGIEGWDEIAYVHPENVRLAEEVLAGRKEPTRTTLLSPFDPVVWDRARASELFGFDYKIEVYTPAAKRRYGYYSLPILHRSSLVGRLDAKAHRKRGVFEVKAVYLEPGVPASGGLVSCLADAIRDCAAWHGTPEVAVVRSDPPELAGRIEAELGSTTKPAESSAQ